MLFGLIGKSINYSFSKKYFTDKFLNKNLLNCSYENFDIKNIEEFSKIITSQKNLKGLNVTIPYKEEIIPFLDKLSKKAKKIKAVNTIKILKNNKTKGYNTDYYGFKKSLQPLLKKHHTKALILGNGGASKAIAFALSCLKIEYKKVYRTPKNNQLGYLDLNASIFAEYTIIINTTPLGTFPNLEEAPPIPYQYFTDRHIAFDLVYNPEETLFLKNAIIKGAVTKNGYEMLVYQAEKSWKIWNKN